MVSYTDAQLTKLPVTQVLHARNMYQMSGSRRPIRNVPDENGYFYLNVLVGFGKTSQTAVVNNN